MNALRCLSLALVLVLPATLYAQEGSVGQPPAAATPDAQAARLEVELERYKETAPEAADVLVRLIDLYHSHGRVFGLIRAAHQFTRSHTADRRHKSVMIKQLDGLEALSRNETLVGVCRQFLERYPDQPESADVELRLARTLERMPDALATAQAWHAVWRRQPKTATGHHAGMRALTIYGVQRSAEAVRQAAELGTDMVRQLEPSPLLLEAGSQAVQILSTARNAADANQLGAQILAKSGVGDERLLRRLHAQMATNYQQLEQYTNAIDHIRRAIKIENDAVMQGQLISLLSLAHAEPDKVRAEVEKYLQAYPQAPDRFDRQALVARAYETAGDVQRAISEYRRVISLDPAAQDAARRLARLSGTSPQGIAECRQVLTEALKNRPDRSDYLTYVLVVDILDQRLHDRAKARDVARRHLMSTTTVDRYAILLAHWLLQTAETEDEFKADVDRFVAQLRSNPETIERFDYLTGVKDRLRGNREKKPWVAYLLSQIQQLQDDPILGIWFAQRTRTIRSADRTSWLKLLGSDVYSKLSPEMQVAVASRAADALRYLNRKRGPQLAAYNRWFQLDPKSYRAAEGLFLAATLENKPDPAQRALSGLLKLAPPEVIAPDTCGRMMTWAARDKDIDLCRQVYQWVRKAESQAGRPLIDYRIGDALKAVGLEAEAKDYWRRSALADPENRNAFNCAARLRNLLSEEPLKAFDRQLAERSRPHDGRYVSWVADDLLADDAFVEFEQKMRDSLSRAKRTRAAAPLVDVNVVSLWLDRCRRDELLSEVNRRRILTVIRDLDCGTSSAIAHLLLLDSDSDDSLKPMDRLLAYQAASRMMGFDRYDWNRMLPVVRELMDHRQYGPAAALLSGILANLPNMDDARRDIARTLTAQCYAQLGAVGMTIDDTSPVAPLLRAALYLRLGDERLAFESLTSHRQLFATHRQEMPGDLLVFACERLIAAGGEQNLNDVETWLREWIIRNGDSSRFDDELKGQVQLLLARSYFKAQRFDVARAEFTTLVNRFPGTPNALEAEFGIGETFVAQKVYDQATAIFDRLAQSRDTDIVVRAEFLRGVVAFARGDVDESRDIFRAVLDRVPSVELADKALFRLSEIYGLEQRYLEQLTLLRTVGRLGRTSKRTHAPGRPLAIVVYDSDLGISRGHNRIPVLVTTVPGGDQEVIQLTSAGAGKGLFRADLDTRLGKAEPDNRILELTGNDVIHCDYPKEFREQFRSVPLSDVEIHIAADAELMVASTKEFEVEQVTFSEELQKEVEQPEDEQDPRLSQVRPLDQIKPGNPLYVRVTDEDRDQGDQPDEVTVKVAGDSGDQVQTTLQETGPHTGVFEGRVETGDLPAGATATDAAIGHAALLAIDRDPATYWQSEPDGRTPKALTVDMKDLRRVSRVLVEFPNSQNRSPVRAELQGSYDGAFWFRIGGNPEREHLAGLTEKSERMQRLVYAGDYTKIRSWQQVMDLVHDAAPVEKVEAEMLSWSRPRDADDVRDPFAVVAFGKLVQPRPGAARIQVAGSRTVLVIDGRAELPLGDGTRSVDVWLSAGTHDVALFAAGTNGRQRIGATWSRANLNSADVRLRDFLSTDFELTVPEAEKRGQPAQEAVLKRTERAWEFQFQPVEIRYVRFVVHEYAGDAVAVNQVSVFGDAEDQPYVPPAVDVVSLASNEVLEIAGGETITATYIDQFVPGQTDQSRLLNASLTATFFDAEVTSISYRFDESTRGGVTTQARRVLRVDPGERFIIQIRDYDEDRSNDPDSVPIEVSVNDGPVVKMTATETEPNSGIFTKEIDTAAAKSRDKIAVKPGDRIFCRYPDTQNTFPGHSIRRETTVLVNQPTPAQMRILDTLVDAQATGRRGYWWSAYRSPPEGRDIGHVTMTGPLTVELIDPDAAKHAESTVTVTLKSGQGEPLDIECVLPRNRRDAGNDEALLAGRFVGQVFLQLGSTDTPDLLPITAGMPRLTGGPIIDEDEDTEQPRRNSNVPTVTRALNVRGTELIVATCRDERRPDGKPAELKAQARLIENGVLECTDQSYTEAVDRLYLGERIYLRLTDPDHDSTDGRDIVEVEISSTNGEHEKVQIEESLPHSGVFIGSFPLSVSQHPNSGNFDVADPKIEAFFGDTVRVTFLDTAALTDSGELELISEVPVAIGTDGHVVAFSKDFADQDLAIETRFTIAESHFELFKSHRELGRTDEAQRDLEAGRSVLSELMDERLDSKYAPRVAYLLGQFAQELGQWNEAINAYQTILRRHGEHALAPDAQYKLAQCYEKMGDFDLALEAYVALAATYPKSPLVADVMIRIADHFFQHGEFDIAAQVGHRFVDKFDSHAYAPKMAFRVGQCRYKAGKFRESGDEFDRFARIYPENELCADALFWAGESFRMANDARQAYQRYNRCRWDFPSSEAAKYARGRLALPEMLRQFEADSRSVLEPDQ